MASQQQVSKTAWYIGAAIALVVVIAGAIAIAASSDDEQAPVPAGVEQVRTIRVDGTSLPRLAADPADPAIGLVAPTLTGQSFDGTPVTTQSDRPRLLVFLAHWCPHCQREVPLLVTWESEGGVPEGLDVIGVSTGVDSDAPNYPPSAWLEKEGFPWPVIADDADRTGAAAMGLPGFPYFVLLRADGTVALRTSGEIDPAALAAEITAALAR